MTASVADASKYGETSSSTQATTTATFTATPNGTHHFLGWSDSANGSILSTDNPFVVNNFASTSTDSSNPTNITRYARFQAYPTTVTPSSAEMTINVGETASSAISYVLSPAGAYDYVRFTSNDASIATV